MYIMPSFFIYQVLKNYLLKGRQTAIFSVPVTYLILLPKLGRLNIF